LENHLFEVRTPTSRLRIQLKIFGYTLKNGLESAIICVRHLLPSNIYLSYLLMIRYLISPSFTLMVNTHKSYRIAIVLIQRSTSRLHHPALDPQKTVQFSTALSNIQTLDEKKQLSEPYKQLEINAATFN
jgi:hypothetical protein